MSSSLVRRLLAAATLVSVVASGAGAQQGVTRITGRVTDRDGGAPLEGAQVRIDGSPVGTITSADGRYTLVRVQPGSYQLRVVRIGYLSDVKAITVTAGQTTTSDFTLVRAPYQLEAVVTTATGQQLTRELGNSIAKIDASELTQKQPITSMQDVLNGRTAGVTMIASSGTVGGGARIRVRGRHAREDNLKGLPPVLTFQSVVDFTVSTRAIVSALYAKLPANGSELLLFDLNRNARFGPLMRSSADTVLTRLLPDAPRNFATTIVTNLSRSSDQVVARSIAAGSTEETVRELNMVFPPGVFSLSHLAIPFPLSDSLYGLQPDTREDYGVNLGTIATRGERGLLVVSIDSLARMSSNPFFDFLMEKVEQGIAPRAQSKP